jgi:hypothetical protein
MFTMQAIHHHGPRPTHLLQHRRLMFVTTRAGA